MLKRRKKQKRSVKGKKEVEEGGKKEGVEIRRIPGADAMTVPVEMLVKIEKLGGVRRQVAEQ